MEGQLEHGDILHGITNNVFQRILDLGPQLREFVTSAKQYHKALLGASVAANSFYQGFTKIAHLASETRGSNKLLGKGICDIIAVHKQIENQANNVIKALNEDFVFPLEEWIEKEINQTKMKQKNYAQENKTAAELVEKSKSNLTKVRKKSQRSKMSDKYEVKEQQILTAHEQYQAKLDELRVLGCHEALKTERNVFSFIVEKMTSVSKIDVGYHEKAYDLLNSRLSTWENLVNQPLSLDVDVSSLVKQLTQNGHYDKSLDEHLSSKNLERTASVGVPTKPNNALSNHRLSHQFSVGFPQIKQDDKSTDMESRGKVQAVFAHDAADSTQLSFKEGDIIKTLTDVTSGWQYGENTRTSKSGWFPVAFTEKVMNVVTSSNPSHTLPLSGHAHPRPPIFPAVNGCQVEPKAEDDLRIPARDYGIPLKNVAKKESNNHISANHNDSVSSGIHSPGNSVSSPDSNQHDLDEPYYPPPPPPPPLPVLEEDDSLSTPLPPPPAPPPPPPSVSPRSFDQAL